jgi:hypothetical protein
LSVSLTFSAPAAGSTLRVLVLKNGTEYSDDVATGGPMGSHEETVELQASLTLDAADYVEVVAFASGGGGEVTVQPGGSLRVEILP